MNHVKNLAGNDVSIFLFRFELRSNGIDFVLKGIRLTRDSWDTTGVTQKRPECPLLEATTLEA